MPYPPASIPWFMDLLFPIRCVGCLAFGPTYLCHACLNSIKIRGSFECIGCKRAVPFGRTCPDCRATNHVDQLYIATEYDQPLVKAVIKTLKYRFIPAMAESLALLVQKYSHLLLKAKHINILEDSPLFIPVPLTRRRQNWRGFNQADILAHRLAQTFQMTHTSDVLMKTKESPPQAEQENRQQRLANTVGIFTCVQPDKIQGRTVLLIDDICTTGATLNACAHTLKEAGATKVIALVIARGKKLNS